MTLSFHRRPVRYRAIGEFTIHSLVANDPRLGARDPRYLRMQAAWEEQDGCPAVYATPDARIVDGRHRFWWLERTGADEVPYIEVCEDEAPLVALAQLQGRNHLTKGQQAYIAAPKLALAFEAAHRRRVAILQSGGRLKLPSIPDTAAMARVSAFAKRFSGRPADCTRPFRWAKANAYVRNGSRRSSTTTCRSDSGPRYRESPARQPPGAMHRNPAGTPR